MVYASNNFQLSVASYLGLHWFCFTSLCDWSRKLTPSSQPIWFVFTLSSHWLLRIFLFLLIGFCDYFGFSFTTLNRKSLCLLRCFGEAKGFGIFFRVILKGECNLQSQKNYKGLFIPNYTRNHMITLTIALHKLFRYHQLGCPHKFLNTGKCSFVGYYLFVYSLNSNSFDPLHPNISMHILHIVLHTILSC